MYHITLKIREYIIFTKGYTCTLINKQQTNVKSNETFVLIFSFHLKTSNCKHTYISVYMNQNSEEIHKTEISNLNV